MSVYDIKRHIRATCITFFQRHAESQFHGSIVSIVEHWLDNCCDDISRLRTLPQTLQAKLPQGREVSVNTAIALDLARIKSHPVGESEGPSDCHGIPLRRRSAWNRLEPRDNRGFFQSFNYTLTKSYPIVHGRVQDATYGTRPAEPLVISTMVHDLQSHNIPIKNGLWGSDLDELPSFLSSLSNIYAKGNAIDNLLAPYLKDFESLRQIQQSFPALVSLVHDPNYQPRSVSYRRVGGRAGEKAQFEEEYNRMQEVDKARQRRRKCKISSDPPEELISLVAEASIIKAAKVGI